MPQSITLESTEGNFYRARVIGSEEQELYVETTRKAAEQFGVYSAAYKTINPGNKSRQRLGVTILLDDISGRLPGKRAKHPVNGRNGSHQ